MSVIKRKTRDTVVRRVFFAADELFGMEKLSVRTGPDLIENRGFQIDVDGARDVLAISCDEQLCGWMDYPSRRKRCSCCHFQSARPSNDHRATRIRTEDRDAYIDSMLKTVELHNISNHCRTSSGLFREEQWLRGEKYGACCFYLPRRVSDLTTGLSHVNGNDFAHINGVDDVNEESECQNMQ